MEDNPDSRWTKVRWRFATIFLLCASMMLFAPFPASAQTARPARNRAPSGRSSGSSQVAGDTASTTSLAAVSSVVPKKEVSQESSEVVEEEERAPHWVWLMPFIVLLGCIAIMPLFEKTYYLWERSDTQLIVSLFLLAVTCFYYLFRSWGFEGASPGVPTLGRMLNESILKDYIPFIILTFSLFTISGGINLKGDIPATPLTNTIFLTLGMLLAPVVSTIGAGMLLIRPLLQVNRERKYIKHTVVFFIFMACNIGGCLLPLGNPPLFLGYLRGVPFLWTMHMAPHWIFTGALVLGVYFVWDTVLYRKEPPAKIEKDETVKQRFRLAGKRNIWLLLGVLLGVAFLVPGRSIPGTHLTLPNIFLREIVLVILALISLRITPRRVRYDNEFNFYPVIQVACLFVGIFVTMQPAVEMVSVMGHKLGIVKPWQYFWVTGFLSSFLDSAPAYVVYFATAGSLTPPGMGLMHGVETVTGTIPLPLLMAISCGAVLMGANSYIGNGPNFMVKSIAEQAGVDMPTFFGYLRYSGLVLVPIFLLVTFIFFM